MGLHYIYISSQIDPERCVRKTGKIITHSVFVSVSLLCVGLSQFNSVQIVNREKCHSVNSPDKV